MAHSMRRGLWVVAVLGALSQSAGAVLGGDAASPARDALQLKSQASAAVPGAGYSVQTVQSDAATTVNEYSANGKVFCVTWSGPRIPDLQVLFGDYYTAFTAHLAARKARGIRGPIALSGDTLVVDSSGRQGAFSGRAYVPALVPAGLDVGSLQ